MITENKKNNKKTEEWFSLEEAMEYLGLGKTTLYSLARNGRIPANKIGKKWLFSKKSLDEWVQANTPIESFFVNLNANIEDNTLLREPQREGYLQTSDFFNKGNNKAILQIPVGCGKSGLASLLPLGLSEGRVLIIAPNLTIKEGLYEAMDITNKQKCFWRKVDVLTDAQMSAGPYATTLDSGNITVAQKSHIVITNIQQLAVNVDKWLTQFPNNFFDMIIVDEAHHSAADSWQKVIDRFPNAKIIHMTATPFRSDRKEIDGTLVYRYPFRSATLKGYIKRLKASYIAPKEVHMEFVDKDQTHYSLDDVLKLKEEVWFSRGIALSPACNQHIVDSSLEKLEELRQTGTKHQLIAVACSINHAKDIRSMYSARGFTAEVIHSGQDAEKQKSVLSDLKNGTLDCIIQVQMLGEGFDHPKLSVAAIFRPFRSLAPYIQFVGRIMRVVVERTPAHPDNLGHIVTHLGMDLDQRLNEFKQFENDDKAFWDKVIGGEEPELPKEVRQGNTRLKARESDVVVFDEIVDALWEEDFTTVEDQHIIDDLREKLKALGLDPKDAEKLVKESRNKGFAVRDATAPYAIQPQRELAELRKRVDESSKRLAKILLTNVALEMSGTELPYKYRTLNEPSNNNFISAIAMVNKEINNRLGKERAECSSEDFKSILEQQDDILQMLARRIHVAKKHYEEKNES